MDDSPYEWMERVRLVDHVLAALAVALPVAAALAAWALRRRGGARWLAWRETLALTALAGPALWALWLAYNWVVDRWGLASLKALGVNVALFAAAALGAVGVRTGLQKSLRRERASDGPLTGAEAEAPSAKK